MAVPRWYEKLFMNEEELAMEKSHEEWKKSVSKENAELREEIEWLRKEVREWHRADGSECWCKMCVEENLYCLDHTNQSGQPITTRDQCPKCNE